MNKILFFTTFFIFSINSFSQLKVGSNPKSITNNTYFEVESTIGNKAIITKDSARLGIGTIKPTQAVHIKSNIEPLRLEGLKSGLSTDSILTVNDSGVVRRIQSSELASNNEPWFNQSTNKGATSNTQNIYQMGRVGVGTTNPRNNLDVVGGLNIRNNIGNNGTGFGMEFNTNASSPRIDWVYDGSYTGSFASDPDFFFRLQNSRTGSGGFRFLTNPSGVGVERLTILNNGNIGVSKTNPLNKFVIRGENKQPSAMGVDQSNAIFRVEGQTNHSLDFGTLNDAPFGSYVQSYNKTATSGLPLSLNPTGGSVGIGTVVPSNTLHVVSSSNPLRIEGLQNGSASDSLLSVNSTGVVRKLAVSSIASGGGSWNNVATTAAATSNTQDIYQMGKVGIGTTTPNSSAVLDLVATDKALLLPRVANTAAIASPVNGMLIYDNASNCIKGYENGAWTNCYSSGGSSASVVQDCNANGLEGNYFNGQALSGTRYTVRITNNSFSSATIAFAASDLALTGVLGMTVGTPTGSPALTSGSITLVAGQSVVVTYPITGTPTSQGTLTARWTKLALTCTRTIAVVNAPPTFNCNGAIITTNRSNLIKDSTYSGTISIPYTVVGGGEAFPAETITSNGLSFTRNAGTYTAPSGSISYTFSGAYTGTTNAVFTINTDNNAGACAIVIFDAIRGALAQGGCTSCAAYDAAAANAWISITATEYARVALINGAGKYVASDAFMSGTPSNSYTGAASATQAIPLQSKVPANEFIVAFSVKNGPSGSTNSSMSGIKLKISGTSQSSGYSDVGAAVTGPTGLGAAVQSYWVRKRPTTTVGTASVWVGYSQIASGQVGISTSSSTNFSAANDVNTITGSQNFAPFIQVLSTPTKQW